MNDPVAKSSVGNNANIILSSVVHVVFLPWHRL